MTIESKLPSGLNQTTATRAAGRAPEARAAGSGSAQGFAGLVSALAVSDDAEPMSAALGLLSAAPADDEENSLEAHEYKGLHSIDNIANLTIDGFAPAALIQAMPNASGSASLFKTSAEPVSASALAEPTWALPEILPATSQVDLVSALPMAESTWSPPETLPGASQVDLVAADADMSVLAIKPDASLTQLSARARALEARVSQIATSALQTQQDGALPASARAGVAAPSLTELVKLASDFDKPKSRPSHGARHDIAGAANVYDKWGASPTHAVVQASAAVPTTQVAETVSYWVTHGVQKADLTLDGLGSEPVEVHISVDGDQTRVDFRTSQIDVRQALESAAGQLKSLLASEGLQLLAVSVGTSARDSNPGGDRRSDLVPQKRHGVVVGVESPGGVAGRVLNSPVGQALDLYV